MFEDKSIDDNFKTHEVETDRLNKQKNKTSLWITDDVKAATKSLYMGTSIDSYGPPQQNR